jgi:hypothetical protein
MPSWVSRARRATRDVELREGERATIAHAFAAEARLRIELVDEHGAPRPGLQVNWWHQIRESTRLVSDAKGVVEFLRVPATEQQVTVGGVSNELIWMRQTVVPGQPVRVVVPAALGHSRVRGRLAARAARPTGTRVVLQRVPDVGQFESSEVCPAELDADSGAFTVDDLPPGRFRLVIATDSALLAMHGPFEVPAEGELDLGAIDVGVGGVQIVGRAIAAIGQPHLVLMKGGEVAFARSPQVVDGALRVVDAPVGSWELRLWGEDIQPVQAVVDVRAGEVATVAIDAVPGTPTTLLLPAELGLLTFSLADGRVVSRYIIGRRRVILGMPRGRHRVELVALGGERHGAEFEVGDHPGEPVQLR